MFEMFNQVPEANTINGAIAALLLLAGRLTRRTSSTPTNWRDVTRKLFVSLSFGVMFRYFQRVHGTDVFAALAKEWQCQRDDARARVLAGLWRTQ